MGRKLKGARLRAHKRGKEHVTEMTETKADQVETQAVTDRSNEELFVIDTKGDTRQPCHLNSNRSLLRNNRKLKSR